MADGDGAAAIHVDYRRIPAHVLVHRAGLGGKGLVRLDQIKVANLPAGPVERLAAGMDRADAHDRGVKPGGGIGGDAGNDLQPRLAASSSVIRNTTGGGAVVDPEALPAVTEPSLVNAGRNLVIASMVAPWRRISSS